MSKSPNENPLSKSSGHEAFANATTLEEGFQRSHNATQANDKETLQKSSAKETGILGNPVLDEAIAGSDQENPFQQECALNSGIWQLYQDKARSVDEHLKESHNSGLDSLLIFAGLFSAVLSAFLIEARKGLQPDPQATTNALLQALLESQSGSPHTYNPPLFKPSLSFKVVNGLWFCSLSFSLLSALGASLAKSWVADYAQVQHKPNAEDAYRRHLRFLGISSWHLTDVVTSLPLLLHIAFFLFAFGLAILLFGDYVTIGAITLVLTVLALILYLGTATVPVFRPDCPYQTPVTTFLIRLVGWIFKSKQNTPSLSNISKAQLLLWLHDICLGSTEMNQVIIAIAGLDRSPDVQDVLHHSRFAKTLCDGLSTVNMQSANLQLLKAYLYTILHLLRTGFPHIGDADDQTTKILLLQLITQGGPLYDCSSVPTDLQEIATCIKARILLRYHEVPRDQVFEITIPLHLKSVTKNAEQKMLREVHLLSLAANQTVLLQLHGEQKASRLNAYKQVEEMARENGAIDVGYLLVINEIYSSMPSIFVKNLKALGHILHKYRQAGSTLLSKIDLEKITSRLDDPSPIVREAIVDFVKSISKTEIYSDIISTDCVKDLVLKIQHLDNHVTKAAYDCINALSVHENIRVCLIANDGMQKVAEKLQNSKETAQVSALNCATALCVHDDIRMSFISGDGIQKVVKKLRGPVRKLALDCIKVLCVNDDIRTSFMSIGGIQKVAERLQDSDWTVRMVAFDCVKALCVHDDIRMSFISPDIISKITEKLQDCFSHRWKFAVYCIEALCVHDDIRASFISMDIISKILEKFQDQDCDAQTSALKCLQTLCLHNDIRISIISNDIIPKFTDKFQDLDGDEQQSALHCITALCVHDDMRTSFISNGIILKIVKILQHSDRFTRISVLNSIKALCVDDTMRTSFISNGIIPKILEKFQDRETEVRDSALSCVKSLCVHADIQTSFISNDIILRILEKPRQWGRYKENPALECVTALCVHDTIRTNFISNDIIPQFLEKLQHLDRDVRQSALDCIAALCGHDDIRTNLISDDIMSKMPEKLQDLEWGVRDSALECVTALCVHDTIRTSFISNDILPKILEKLQHLGRYTQNSVLNCVPALCAHDDIRTSFISNGIIPKFMQNFQDLDKYVPQTALHCITALCVHDDIRTSFISNDITPKIVEKLQHSDTLTQISVLISVKNLCVHDTIRKSFISHGIVPTILEKFQDRGGGVQDVALNCAKALCLHDDFQSSFFSSDAIQKVLQMTQNSNSNVRSAGLNFLKAFCLQDNIRNLQDSHSDAQNSAPGCVKALSVHSDIWMSDGIQKVVEKLQDSDSHVRSSALGCIEALCLHDDIRLSFISSDGMQKVLEKLEDSDLQVRKSGLHCVTELCKHDQILRTIYSPSNISIVTNILKSQDSDSETHLYLASILVPSLALNENDTLIMDTLNTVSHLLQAPHTSQCGLLILEQLSEKYMEVITKSGMRETLHAMLVDINNVDRLVAVEALLILGWL